jgi:endonuclease YncB( thermonuclease family)
MTTGAASMIRTSPAWCCSTAAAERALEQQARSSRVGIWGGRDEEDDQAYPYQLQR